jgi:hypothetical protein
VSPLSPPVRIGRSEPVILVDTVIRWGPVCVLTARPARDPAIIVEYAAGLTPITFRRTELSKC